MSEDLGFTVKDLKAVIKDLPDDMRVIQQSDSEGNGFRWCAGADPGGVLTEDKGWYAEIASADWTSDDACMEQEKWDEFLKAPRVLVIHPTN